MKERLSSGSQPENQAPPQPDEVLESDEPAISATEHPVGLGKVERPSVLRRYSAAAEEASSLRLSTADLKRAAANLMKALKQCWPRIFPDNRRVPALQYTELTPAFCAYARELFDGYMRASDLENIDFRTQVEKIQKALLNRIAPEPMLGLSWGARIGIFEAIVEWTREGWIAKISAPGKWIWRQLASDLATGKQLALNEAAVRANLMPAELEKLHETLRWYDRGYPPKDLHSFMQSGLPTAPGEWEQYVATSWNRFDHPDRAKFGNGDRAELCRRDS
jgi:hypothetical protein